MQPEHAPPRAGVGLGKEKAGNSGEGRRNSATIGTATTTIAAETEHHRAPAVIGDPQLEQRRPDHAGDVLAGRNDAERDAAAPVEPAAHIDDQRRIKRAVAEEADQHGVSDQHRPQIAACRDGETKRDHRRAEHDRRPDADPLGDLPHDDAAEPGAEPGQRGDQRDELALRAEILGDRLQPDDGEQRRSVGNRQQPQREAGRNPRLARFDARPRARPAPRPAPRGAARPERSRARSDDFGHRPASPQRRLPGTAQQSGMLIARRRPARQSPFPQRGCAGSFAPPVVNDDAPPRSRAATGAGPRSAAASAARPRRSASS